MRNAGMAIAHEICNEPFVINKDNSIILHGLYGHVDMMEWVVDFGKGRKMISPRYISPKIGRVLRRSLPNGLHLVKQAFLDPEIGLYLALEMHQERKKLNINVMGNLVTLGNFDLAVDERTKSNLTIITSPRFKNIIATADGNGKILHKLQV